MRCESVTENIRDELFRLRDVDFLEFQARLIPTIDKNTVIGVRTPALRRLAKSLCTSDLTDTFLSDLPHKYYDENNLHSLILNEIKDEEALFYRLEEFLPFIDNWATCDMLRPALLKSCRTRLLCKIKEWLCSKHPFTVRFAIEMLMCHFLEEDFSREYLSWVSKTESREYYVKMMCAWYFAEALAKQYDSTIAYFEKGLIFEDVYEMAVRKARESLKITGDRKEYLLTLLKKIRSENK